MQIQRYNQADGSVRVVALNGSKLVVAQAIGVDLDGALVLLMRRVAGLPADRLARLLPDLTVR